MIRLFMFALLALALPMSSAAQDCIEYDEYPHFISSLITDNITRTVNVDGDLAYFSGYSASGPNHFHIAEIGGLQSPELIADPTNPQIIQESIASYWPYDVAGGRNAPIPRSHGPPESLQSADNGDFHPRPSPDRARWSPRSDRPARGHTGRRPLQCRDERDPLVGVFENNP